MLALRILALGRAGTGLAWIGQRTLPIFVLHVPLLAVVHGIAVGPGKSVWAQFLDSFFAAALYSPVGTFVTVGVCLAAYAGVQRIGKGWLILLPLGRHLQPPRSDRTSRNRLDMPGGSR